MASKDHRSEDTGPHYYSKFWLDVAAGRNVIGASPRSEAEPEEMERPEQIERPEETLGRSEDDQKQQEEMVEEITERIRNLDEDWDVLSQIEEEDLLPVEKLFADDEEEDEEIWPRDRKKTKSSKPIRPSKPPKPRRRFP